MNEDCLERQLCAWCSQKGEGMAPYPDSPDTFFKITHTKLVIFVSVL